MYKRSNGHNFFTHPALLGIFFTLAFAPLYLWALGLGVIALLFRRLQHTTSPKKDGFWFGFAHGVTSLYWIPQAFYMNAGNNWLVGLGGGIPALLAMSVVLGGIFAGICYLTAKPQRKLYSTLIFISTWLSIEILRSLHPLGFPWNLIGSAWANSEQFLQIASVGGVYGMSFIFLMCGVLLSFSHKTRVASLLILVLCWSAGQWRLIQNPTSYAENAPYIRLIQPAVTHAHKWDPHLRQVYVEQALNLIKQPSQHDISTFILPETAVPYFLNEDAFMRDILTKSLKPHQTLITGFSESAYNTKNQQTTYYNSVGLLTALRNLQQTYRKQILVPFGEYLPLRKMLSFLPTFAFHGQDFGRGKKIQTLQSHEHLSFLPLICYEGIFPLFVMKNLKQTQSTALLSLTNDNWFMRTSGPWQHAALTRIRAVENGLPLIRAANTGISYVIDSYGRQIAQITSNKHTFLDLRVPKPSTQPPVVKLIYLYISNI